MYRFISKTVQDIAAVYMIEDEHELVCYLSNGAISNNNNNNNNSEFIWHVFVKEPQTRCVC